MRPWPVKLRARTPQGLEVVLRPLHRRDRDAWLRLRRNNREWLGPWDATAPNGRSEALSFPAMVRQYTREARALRMLPFAIEVDGQIAGAMQLYGIAWGSMRSASAGYWVGQEWAGRSITPTALAMVCDYAIGGLELHRIEINIRPENANSLAVVAKLGLRDEGIRQSYLHIDGAWRDHRAFALTADDLGGATVMSRLRPETVEDGESHR